MLYVLPDGTIRLTRGDTATLYVPIINQSSDKPDEEYIMNEKDTIEFSIKKSVRDEEPLVHKRVMGTNGFQILPSDTKPLSFGKYVYDVQLTTSNGEVYTVVEPNVFEVMKEVT